MPKVLHLIKSLGRGGAEMLLPETLKLHDRSRFEFHCIYFLPWKNQMAAAIEQAGGQVVCLSASNNLQILLAARKIVQYVKAHDIDVIHCHLPWAGFVGRIVHRMSGVPLVYTEHNKQERYHWLTFWLNKLSFNHQDKSIAVSQDVALSIQDNIAPSIPVQVVLNGVNTETFQRSASAGKALKQALGIPEDALVIGTVAVFRFQKRLEEWLEIFKVISERHENVYGIIIGDGILKADIMSKRTALGLEERVLMPGLQTDTLPFFSMIDIYLMSSMFEGLPIALLEAMSTECAVATTNAGGIKEMITDGVDGLVVDVDDWVRLSDKASLLVSDSDLRHRLAAAARARVIEAFSLQRMVDELELIYSELSPARV